jgi:hypothetical protein
MKTEKIETIDDFIRKYGKRKNEISEADKSKMIEITYGNEVYYIPKKEFYKLSEKQLELEIEEDLHGFNARK